MHRLILCWPALINGLFKCVENKASVCCTAGTPTDDAPRKDIDDEGHIYKPLPGCDVGEVTHPEYVWRRRIELAVHPI